MDGVITGLAQWGVRAVGGHGSLSCGSWAIRYGKGELKYGDGGQLPEWTRTIPGRLWAGWTIGPVFRCEESIDKWPMSGWEEKDRPLY